MKRLLIAVSLVLITVSFAAATVSCAPVPSVSGQCTSQTVVDDKVAYAAEALYNVPAQAYVTANKNGTLPADIKAKAKPILLEMYKKLLLVRSAHDACAYDQLLAYSVQVKSLLGVN